MQSNQPGSNGHFNCNEPDISAEIPDLARAWESASQVASSVRRPSTLPGPESYHEVIEPEAIFELDERQKDGSIKTIFVVPYGCNLCKSLKQACSRTRPACVRCKKAGIACQVNREGYQRLPRPKAGRPSMRTKSTSGTSMASNSTRELTAGHSRAKRSALRVASLSPPPSTSALSSASGSKRSLSPGSDVVPPRKKARAKTTSRKGKAPPKGVGVESSEVSTMDPSAQVVSAVALGGERSTLRWTFMNRNEKYSPGEEHARSIPSNTMIPRIWTNSLGGLLTVFPELTKSRVGLSWLQSEVPILLLDTNYTRSHWINSTALSIDLSWDFSCHDSELEPSDNLETGGSTQLHSCQPAVHSTLDCEAETMVEPFLDGVHALTYKTSRACKVRIHHPTLDWFQRM
ncbi:hypothetical protein HD554DRAFT_1751027 [Boletus coccyginus]|nr:hypothetical protein HD554DRAFT_1751027 [Boletus coccyginus]